MPIIYIGILPTPLRWHVRDEAVDSNTIVSRFAEEQGTVTYVDLSEWVLNNGSPDRSLFRSDLQHLNAAGYEAITPPLKSFILNIF
ncbi:hypothetical protein I5L03_12755 [Erythrobacter sp. JGD-13]|uniref:SGNH hydrolase-type esterase domain-containing protein n=2 Tax=Aurantiacibacter sediminis TaxID=2793064 RepID=A0ABS0N6J8_9SPHN|nr:hypothetical protein [Aurantiacibacter sediminis]